MAIRTKSETKSVDEDKIGLGFSRSAAAADVRVEANVDDVSFAGSIIGNNLVPETAGPNVTTTNFAAWLSANNMTVATWLNGLKQLHLDIATYMGFPAP